MSIRLLSVFITLSASAIISSNGEFQHGNMRNRKLIVRDLNARAHDSNGKMKFPEEISATLDVEGLETKNILAKRRDNVRLPVIEEVGQSGKQKKKMVAPETSFYVSDEGSFLCKPKGPQRDECDMVAVVHEGEETCFIKNGKAHCAQRVNGTDEVINPSEGGLGDGSIQLVSPQPKGDNPRIRRNIVEPDSGTTRVINVAMVYDAAYMERFAAINDGNYAAAIEDVLDMSVLVINEISHRYSSVKTYNRQLRGVLMDLACNLVLVEYPAQGYDWSFITTLGEGAYLDYRDTLPDFADWAYNSGITSNSDPAHHATLITGLDLTRDSVANSNILGVAYLYTVCYYTNRVSINEELDYNLANVLAHEIGHALGASHDSDGNPCNAGEYIMSSYAFVPTSATKDTRYQFSSCSVDDFEWFLNDYASDCLDYMDASFTDNFCKGPRGTLDGALDDTAINRQCERFFHGSGYTECNDATKVAANSCWKADTVSCKAPGSTVCENMTYVVDGTPCIGSDPAKDYFCFLGDCLEWEGICGVTTTTTTPAPTTTTPAPTTTTPAPTTTTTPAPTTTTPAPTTTTTPAPTTTTPAPTTTTTPAPTTTTPAPTTTTTPAPTTTTPAPTTTTTPAPTTTTPAPTTTTTPAPTTTTPAPTTTTPAPTTTTSAPSCPCGRWRWYCCVLYGILSCC